MPLLFLTPIPLKPLPLPTFSHLLSIPVCQHPRASATPVQVGPFPSITPLCLGTWSWGNRVLYDYSPSNDSTLFATLETALTLGVNLIDTADSYGTFRYNARAEVLLGKFLTNPPPDLVIATKFAAYPWRLTPRSIVNAAEASSDRLRRVVDLGQLHWSASNYLPIQERALWQGIADAKEQGYIREIGVSNFGPQQLRRFANYLQEQRGMKLASAQTQLSLLRREAVEGDLLRTTRELEVGLLGYSPLCLGLLSGKYRNSPPAGLRRFLFRQLQQAENLLPTLEAVATTHNASVAQIAIAWVLSHDICTISGARTPSQVESAIRAQDITLSKEEIARLETAARNTPQMIANAFETS